MFSLRGIKKRHNKNDKYTCIHDKYGLFCADCMIGSLYDNGNYSYESKTGGKVEVKFIQSTYRLSDGQY